MNVALELHDSEIEFVAFNGSSLDVRFSAAYLHCSDGQPGIDPGEGHVQPALLSFGRAKLIGALPQRFGRILNGAIVVSGRCLSLISVPSEQRGLVLASFQLAQGDTLTIEADSVVSSRFGQSTFVERFPG